MKPSKIKAGQKLKIQTNVGGERTAYFIERIPAQCHQKAVNFLRFPDFAGFDGLDDNGTCQMSDYDLSRRGTYA